MLFNIPILITFLRIALIPFFVLVFYLPFQWAPLVCALIFICAALTDFFDGFLARRWNQTTKFGEFLDPVADKVMVVIALVLIAEYFHSWWITLPVSTIISREIIISSLREWMAEIGKHSSVEVSWIGKIKTTMQMVALFILLWRPDHLVEKAGITALYIAAVLTFWSMFQYLNASRSNWLKSESK
ncbi:CDP-diacylglycerol--glycerol-3-phosphate 3-phosphatidyltransferase [Candidatus Erwinia haradaeae]|uniref:CDP-diacylglycerol--glycerol-3-phosphate 3-phosphatidyltransferase n=1 Tax=Candidatus Erwinia haradaeae TaxID=1922217 RepID=A0A451D2R6_9GAMM|nr:CDP-diacylglycerol--glycerol-3-phosphate 3-phosphatidyltransferase [Candidatus Erwinia haradaeae]VFP79927.1 CDP-diacylglycerol--glycerol-3-phosphate 3-phosphatidyltransferase [Candidatus Erwinia haradaeae]